jgi:hypothetical protein
MTENMEEDSGMYDAKRRQQMIELSNRLSLTDLAILIEINAERIQLHNGCMGSSLIGGELSSEDPVCMNGAFIQLNAESSDLDDMRDEGFVREATKNPRHVTIERLSDEAQQYLREQLEYKGAFVPYESKYMDVFKKNAEMGCEVDQEILAAFEWPTEDWD